MKRKFYLLASAAALLAAGCGGTGDPASAAVAVEMVEDSAVTLCLRDSIGVENGDTNYVMGGVEGVSYCPDGSIAVLDRGRFSVRVYSSGGDYLRSFGGRGHGPGEFGSMTFMAVTDSGTVALAGTAGDEMGVHFYEYASGDWVGSCRTFVPPSCLEAVAGDDYLRKDIDFFLDGDDIYLPVSVSLYRPLADDPSTTFHADTVLFDPARETELLMLDWYGYDIAAGPEGNVYIAPRSTEEARVMVFDLSGHLLRELALPYEPVERTPEELEMERNILRAKALASGENPEGLEPDPYKPMIRGLEVDERGNLWVLQGGPSRPTFSVVTAEGEHLFEAVLEKEPPDGSSWRFHIGRDGMLAYAEDPAAGYQKIYMLEPAQMNLHP